MKKVDTGCPFAESVWKYVPYNGLFSVTEPIANVSVSVEFLVEHATVRRLDGEVKKPMIFPSTAEEQLMMDGGGFNKSLSKALRALQNCYAIKMGKEGAVELLGYLYLSSQQKLLNDKVDEKIR